MFASMFSFCIYDLNFCVIMYLLLHLQLPLVGLLQVLLTLLLLPQRLDVHVEVHHVALDLEGQMLLVCGHNARLFLDLAGVRDLLGHQPPLRLVLRGRLRLLRVVDADRLSLPGVELRRRGQSFSFCESVILQCSVKYTVVIDTNRYSK